MCMCVCVCVLQDVNHRLVNIVNGNVIAIYNVRGVIDWVGFSLCGLCKCLSCCFVHLKPIKK